MVSAKTIEANAERSARARPIHPVIVRITHWINAAAMIVMILSGWQIHNAYPTLPFPFPSAITLGDGLADGLKWHFAAMWVLALNGIVYLTYGIASGRFRRKLFPIRARELVRDIRAALNFQLGHADISIYNAVQRLLYAGIIVVGVIVVLTGLAIWKPVQFQDLTMLFGDFDNARLIHFLAMAAIVGFLIIHVAMALLVPKSLRAMITGR